MSKIHMLDIIHARFERGMHRAVHLRLCWDFMAKKKKLSGQPDLSFSIPPLLSIVGVEDKDKLLLCTTGFHPLRQDRRCTPKQLFIPVSESMTEISCNTISLRMQAIMFTRFLISNYRELLTPMRFRQLPPQWLYTVIVL